MKNQPTEKRKGIIYVRVSSQEQVQGTSLENQQRECHKYAEREGIEIVETFIERGESATAANRTQLIKALDLCSRKNKNISAFIVWKVDRFARNQTDHFALKAQLAKYGARLHSVTEPIADDPIGRAFEGMLSTFSQFENDVRKQRCESGMQRKVQEGIWPWLPPIGYIHAKKLQDRRKTRPDEPDPERFFLIQKALKVYAEGGRSGTEICSLLNQWGFRTRQGKPMRKQFVSKILNDPFYAGMLRNPWSGKLYPGQHQAMIMWEEYERIQQVQKGYSRHLDRPRSIINPDFPLRRFVKCTCDGKLTASWHKGRNKKYAFYHCHNKNCSHYTHTIPKDVLEDAFVELLQQIAPTEQALNLFRETVLDEWNGKRTLYRAEREHFEREVKKLEAQKERLTEMRISGEVSRDEYAKLKDAIDNKLTGLTISRNEAKTEELNMETLISFATQFLSDLVRQWQEMGIERKYRLQKLVLPQGIAYDKTTGTFGTAVLSPGFKLLHSNPAKPSDFVAGAGIAPATSRL